MIYSNNIGNNCKIHNPVWLGDEVKIGNNCKIQAFAFIPNGVELEDDVFIGPSVVFTNDKMPPSGGKYWAKTLIKRGVSIGANTTILPGIIIGEGALIGAGSVITKDIPANEIWKGNPAKFYRKRLNWCVLGHKGFVAPRHIKAIEEIGDRVNLVCDIDQSWEEMMKNKEWENIDAVAICTPNYLHYPMSKAMKDKIVICEKPLTISSKDCENLGDNVNTVLQLRHHPEIIKLKELYDLGGVKTGELVVKVKRDQKYWDSWKGRDEQSGGILFNLGIHYFDILIYLFGNDYQIKEAKYSDKKATGIIDFNGTEFSYHIEIMSDDIGQTRHLKIDGLEVVLSKQDNLSFEDLHKQVYLEVRNGGGVKPKEAIKSIKLVEALCKKTL